MKLLKQVFFFVKNYLKSKLAFVVVVVVIIIIIRKVELLVFDYIHLGWNLRLRIAFDSWSIFGIVF